jgi:hypothetical protein
MSSVVTLLTLSALMGFALARAFSWFGLWVTGIALALLSAAFSGIAVIAACLSVNQASCLTGLLLASRRSENRIQKHADNEPSRSRDKYVGYDQEQRSPSTRSG